MRILGSLVADARLDISVDLEVYAGPPVVASDKFSSPSFV